MMERTYLEICCELRNAREKFPMPNPTFVALVEDMLIRLRHTNAETY